MKNRGHLPTFKMAKAYKKWPFRKFYEKIDKNVSKKWPFGQKKPTFETPKWSVKSTKFHKKWLKIGKNRLFWGKNYDFS